MTLEPVERPLDTSGPAAAGPECAYLFWQHEDDPPHALVGSLLTLDAGMTTVRAADEAEFAAAVEQEMTRTGRPGSYVLVRRPRPHPGVASCPSCRLEGC